MGKNYTDEVGWVLDGVAESISDGKCSGLTPSETLYTEWSMWQEAIAKVLLGWGDKRGLGDNVARLLQSENYFAWDVYATLNGDGVGVWDGRWAEYLGKEYTDDVENHLKLWLPSAFRQIQRAVEDEAFEQCEGDDGDDTAPMFEGVRVSSQGAERRQSRPARLPSWTRRPR